MHGTSVAADRAVQGRVLHVTTVHQPGDNRIFHKECAGLAAAGFDVHLLAMGPPPSEDKGVVLHLLERRRSRLQRAVSVVHPILSEIRRIRPDVLHIHDPELIPTAWLWSKWTGRHVVFDAHEDFVNQVRDKEYLGTVGRVAAVALARALVAIVRRSFSVVVVATPYLARNFPKSSCVLVQNFPWKDEFQAATEYPRDTRSVVYVGGVSLGRGLLEMIRAVEESTASELVLAGPLQPESLLPVVEAAEKVRYLGRIPPEDVPKLLAAGNVGLCVLHPLENYVNAQSTKIYEYMAAARPFIYSNFPRWVEQFDGQGVGHPVDPLAVDAIRDLIDSALADPQASEAEGLRARKVFIEKFTFDSQLAALTEMTRALLGQPKRSKVKTAS